MIYKRISHKRKLSFAFIKSIINGFAKKKLTDTENFLLRCTTFKII